MKRNADILKEWESIGATFSAHIGLPNMYVPEHYFQHLSDDIISGIRAISVPEQQLPTIDVPYTLPQGYFEQLPQQIIQKVKEAEAIINATDINGLPKANVFELPEGYFEALPEQVMAGIYAETDVDEELADSPLLAALKGKMPFEAPAEMEPIEVAPKVTVKEKPEIEVPMTVRKSLRWSNWVAAAAVALFFVTGAGWLHWDNRTSSADVMTQDAIARKLAAIPDAAIEAYFDQNADEFNEYLLEENIASAPMALEASLNGISDDELEAFMSSEMF